MNKDLSTTSTETPALPMPGRRLQREWRTVRSMIELYCRDRHGCEDVLCARCAGLAELARCRLEKCPFGDDKPTCARCPIHCYRARARQREQMKEVMRYAGPRMILRHPILAMYHMLDSRREIPVLSRRRSSSAEEAAGRRKFRFSE